MANLGSDLVTVETLFKIDWDLSVMAAKAVGRYATRVELSAEARDLLLDALGLVDVDLVQAV
jgi:hypothetical protein